MKRLIPVAAALVAAAGAATFAGASGEDDGVLRHKVVLDNAFGLTEGADLRAAGVNVGQIEKLDVDARTARAVVTIRVDDSAFGGFSRDTFCAVEPQSLIGEYFMDCRPGKGARLPDGGTIPVEQTGGTIPPDLVNDIMRRPYRERFGILIAELGAAFAARGDDINATIARAIPALRETDRVLKILADERRTIQQLTRDGEEVITTLADNRDGVARFVSEARDAASASADRRTDLAATIRDFPRFQRELRPTLAALGTAAREQTPALADLRAAAPTLTTLLGNLGPFSEASQPAIRALAQASVTGRRAVRVAGPTVNQLRVTATKSEEPFRNLRFVLEHLNDRDNAVEPASESPTGRGFTGLEAFLRYAFVQSQAINVFDIRGYVLKLNALINDCGAYTNGESRRADPDRARRCNSDLGPEPASAFEPEPAGSGSSRSASASTRSVSAKRGDAAKAKAQPAASSSSGASSGDGDAGKPAAPAGGATRRLELPGLPPIDLPAAPAAPGASGDRAGGETDALLDLLLR